MFGSKSLNLISWASLSILAKARESAHLQPAMKPCTESCGTQQIDHIKDRLYVSVKGHRVIELRSDPKLQIFLQNMALAAVISALMLDARQSFESAAG